MRAISTVIASILMLMIVIGLGGVTYLYISGVFTGKTATIFEVIESVNDTVIIRNSGTESIRTMTATLDGSSTNIAVVPNIQGVVSYWSMNDGSGITTSDNSGNNVGTLRPSCPNCPTWVNGKYSNALQFDGIDDYVSLPNTASLNITGSITVAAWVKINDITSYKTIVDKGGCWGTNGFVLAVIPNLPRFYVPKGNSEQAISSVTIVTGQWYHLAGTYNGSDILIYVNGEQTGNKTQTTGLIENQWSVWLGDLQGGAQCGSGTYFNGIIDEVGIYNRALSENEIKQLSSGLVTSGQLAAIKPLSSLTKGTHTLKLCTSSMCNTAYLTIN